MARTSHDAAHGEEEPAQPFVSVIIPVYNAKETLARCLNALADNAYPAFEYLVIDDGSDDGSAGLAQSLGAQVIHTKSARSGPAAARNAGAGKAQGSILLFLDADIMAYPDTVERVACLFSREPDLAATIGSYDNSPAAANFLSQYKNLQHHYIHQISREEASTFWAGCGAIRRDIFFELGGFNTGYSRPSIEDIELGYRLRRRGHRIRLDKELQVKHLKRWSARTLLVTDIRDRAIPWSRLLLQEKALLNDLNLQTHQRASVIAAWLGLSALVGCLFFPWLLLLAGIAILALLLLNATFYRFLLDKKGLLFTLMALPWHWLYFLYSGLAFALILIWLRLVRADS